MAPGAITVAELAGAGYQRGLAHGEQFAAQIRAYADERLGLICDGVWNQRGVDRATVLAIAEACVSAHETYAPDLTDELRGLAEGAGCSVPEALVGGGFTDIVDAIYAATGAQPGTDDDCTAVLIPAVRAGGAALLAQTWDMHASAVDYVVMLDIQPVDGPRSLLLSTTGCLGQIGMNDAGICVGINNLSGADGRPGVTWPFVVRKALLETDIDRALACVVDAPLAGAHNFLLLGPEGRGYNVEAYSTVHSVTELAGDVLAHTNHALAEATLATSQPRPEDLQASSLARLETVAAELQADELGLERAFALLRHPTVCYGARPPLDLATCGAVVMRPGTRELWACWGRPDERDYELFSLAA